MQHSQRVDGNGPERHPQCGTAVLSSATADGEVLRMGPMRRWAGTGAPEVNAAKREVGLLKIL